MNKVTIFDISRLHQMALFDFLTIVDSTATAVITDEIGKALQVPLHEAINNYDAALKQARINEMVKKVNAADKVADDAWRYTRAYLKAMQQHPNNTIAELARSTYIHTFDKYGDIANMGEKDEYGAYKNLLGDLAAIPSDTLTTLALGPWVENMTLAQAKHEVLRNQRVNEDATYQTGLAKQARLDAEAAYRTFVEKLNALIIINGPEPYASFVNSINVVINELLTTMKANDTRNKNKKEDPTEPETPDTPETPEGGTTPETSA